MMKLSHSSDAKEVFEVTKKKTTKTSYAKQSDDALVALLATARARSARAIHTQLVKRGRCACYPCSSFATVEVSWGACNPREQNKIALSCRAHAHAFGVEGRRTFYDLTPREDDSEANAAAYAHAFATQQYEHTCCAACLAGATPDVDLDGSAFNCDCRSYCARCTADAEAQLDALSSESDEQLVEAVEQLVQLSRADERRLRALRTDAVMLGDLTSAHVCDIALGLAAPTQSLSRAQAVKLALRRK